MTAKFEREERYIVVKLADLSEGQLIELKQTLHGMRTREAAVIEKDWPQYEQVWDMLKHWDMHGELASLHYWYVPGKPAGANEWRDECLARDIRYFLRDHGQALVEAVADAERYRWLMDNATIEAPFGAVSMKTVPPDEPGHAKILWDAAIDARSKTVDGGGV